jgi:hypothetical protein
MKACHLTALTAVALLAPGMARSQTTNTVAEVPLESSTNLWSFYASAYGYFVPHSRDYVNPNFAADHHWLHLEARYNYEGLDTGSVWAGYNFSTGEKLVFNFTPMVGGVFGDLKGVAPGYNLSLSYNRFLLSGQGEYFFDSGGSAGNYFYAWSELSYSPVSWFRTGLAMQRTRAYKSDLEIQYGLLVGCAYKRVEFTAYIFDFGWTDPTVVLAVGFGF